MRRISDFIHGKDNNFNLLRFVAASLVLLSHCWPLVTGSNDDEPLHQHVGVTLGTSAVLVFFSVSGFLVASSWERRPQPLAFAAARFFRIFPGLLVALAVSAFVIGPAISTLAPAEYWLSPGTWTYVPSNLLLVKPQLSVPGVLVGARYNVLNGSLWTLAYEVACYALLLQAACGGLLRRERFAGLAAACLALGLGLALVKGDATKGFAFNMLNLGASFAFGIGLWVWRSRIPLSAAAAGAALLVALLALATGLPGSRLLYGAALAYGALYLAYVPGGRVRRFNTFGDCSYGVYIYAFPVQQALLILWPGLGVVGLFAAALPVTVVLAALSWTWVEKPAMRFGTGWVKRRA